MSCVQRYKTYLERECMESLLGHKEHGKEKLQSTDLESLWKLPSLPSGWAEFSQKRHSSALECEQGRSQVGLSWLPAFICCEGLGMVLVR